MNRNHVVTRLQSVFAIVICILVFVPEMSGQAAAPQPSSEGWQFRIIPYLWGTSLDGRVGVGDRSADVNASFSNILDHLHFALMGLGDATWNNKIVLLTDALYTDLRGYRATPGPLFSSVNPNQKLFLLTPEGGYRMLDTGKVSLDVVGGIRYWHLKTELQFQPAVLPGIDVQGSRGWVDGILGLRGKVYLPRKSWVTGYGDLGGGGSNFTYQILGIAGVDIHEHYALLAGYRYLNVDYDKDHFLFDTALKGPLFGFTFKF
jgi:hypothetical protein